MLQTVLVLIAGAVVLPAALAADGPVASVAPGVLWGPLGDGSDEFAPGGRASFDVPVGPLRASVGAGVYRFGSDGESFGGMTMVLPEAGVAYAPSISVDSLDIVVSIGALYRHYLAWYRSGGQEYLAYRPVASLAAGTYLAIGDHLSIGPTVVYSLLFEQKLRHAVEPQIGIRLSL